MALDPNLAAAIITAGGTALVAIVAIVTNNKRTDELGKRLDARIADNIKRFDDRFDDLNKRSDDRFNEIRQRFNDLNKNLDERFDNIDRRFDEMNDLWRAELRRVVEEVLDARLKHLEEK